MKKILILSIVICLSVYIASAGESSKVDGQVNIQKIFILFYLILFVLDALSKNLPFQNVRVSLAKKFEYFFGHYQE
jgi:hypothetical protein